jgi:DNA-binding MarR family transcriptional regulator
VEIESWVTLDKSAISRAVAQLLQAGLVKRLPRADDARAADILLTPAGRRLSRRVTDKMEALQTRLLEAIPTADRQQLFDTLDALEAALRQGPPASGAGSATRAKRAKRQVDA